MLPAGEVTFLMTDIEASTRAWEEHPDTMGAAIERHDELIARAVDDRGGVLIRSKGEGDSTFSVFGEARDAVVAAVDLQRALRTQHWPEGISLRVRAALYTAEAEPRDGDYFGIGPNRCARLRAVVHGGQTVCAQVVADHVGGSVPTPIVLHDLGLHRLRDLARAERLYQVSHPDLPGDFPPLRSLGVRHNLPALRTSFVGRDHDLVAVDKLLDVDRLVTLTGVGGCGKTRLAIEVASGRLERHPDGVFFADLGPVSDPHIVPGAVAGAVGFGRLGLGTGSGRPSRELLDFLEPRDVLVVLDNCEHVVDACADLVDEILERCPNLSVLATSREALELRGEQVYPVTPLAVPDADAPDGAEAAWLFLERARAVKPDFNLDDVRDDVTEICRRLDGLPLAIELAAAQVAYLSPRQILERLSDLLHLSGGGRRIQRQRTLEAALDWSHATLGEQERIALRRFSVFPGSFSLEAAEAVCADIPATEMLRSLVRRSLVTTVDGLEVRFRLLETVRLYAESKLTGAGEDVAVRDLHRDHFLSMVEAIPAEETYLDPDGIVRGERHNLRAAMAWSAERGRHDLVGRIASTMNRIWLGDIREGRRWLAMGMQAIDELETEHRVRVLAVAAHVAVLAMEAGDGELARRAVEASGGEPGVWSSMAHALLCFNAGIRFFVSKNPVFADEAERLGAKAAELAPGQLSLGLAWFFRAQARLLSGDLDGAIEAFELGSVGGIRGGDMSTVSLAMMAGTLHLAGRHERARAIADQVIERARSFHGGGLWAWALYSSLPHALELGVEGHHQEAVTFVRESLEDGGTPHTPGVMTSVVVVLAALAALREDHESAAVLLGYAGDVLIREGIRTPVDIELYSHYLRKVEATLDDATMAACRQRGAGLSVDEALTFGLRVR